MMCGVNVDFRINDISHRPYILMPIPFFEMNEGLFYIINTTQMIFFLCLSVLSKYYHSNWNRNWKYTYTHTELSLKQYIII